MTNYRVIFIYNSTNMIEDTIGTDISDAILNIQSLYGAVDVIAAYKL